MASQNITVVDTKVLSDGQLAVLVRCENDPTTDSWHTMTIDPNMDDAEIDTFIASNIADHKQRVARLYTARQKVHAKLAGLKNLTTKVNV